MISGSHQFIPVLCAASQEHGFDVGETIENYYKRIDPPDCYVLRRRLPEEC